MPAIIRHISVWNAIYSQPLWDSKSEIENQLRGGEKDRPLIWSESAIKPIQPAIVNLFKFYCLLAGLTTRHSPATYRHSLQPGENNWEKIIARESDTQPIWFYQWII